MSPVPLDLYLADAAWPWIDALTFTPMLLMLFVFAYFWHYSSAGRKYVAKQSDYLDHQRDVGDKIVLQNKTYEEMIAKQYQDNNERSDRALSQSEEALRLHAASLEQLAAMNQTMARLAEILVADKGPRTA